MKAIILDHPNDLNKFDIENKSLKFYAYNFHTYQKLSKNKKIKYINNHKILSKYDNFSHEIANDWFKKNRIKNLKVNKISIGTIILTRLFNEYSNTLKNYLLIKKILSNNNQIFFPKSKKIFIKNIIEFFPNKIKFYSSRNHIEELISTNQIKSQIISLPSIHKYSRIARFIQNIFFSINKNKVIYYPEPKTKFFFNRFSNILSLNSLKFWNSYYFNYSPKYLKKAKILIDLNYHKDLKQYLNLKEKKKNFVYLKIFEKSINNIVKQNKKNILRTLSIYIELFDYYRPKSIILPGILNFDYAIAIELSKIKKIKSFIALDGVLTNYDQAELHKNYVFDKIIAWGNENKILLQKHKIKQKDIVLSTTFHEKLNLKNYLQKKYIIVLPLVHYSQKVSSHSDKNVYHTINILKVLNKMHEKNIILKIKDGNYEVNKIVDFYEKYISDYGLKNISIKSGKMENYLMKAKLIIGQCSSTIYEAVKYNVSYHIYEPYDLGLRAKDIKNSNLFNRKTISRNQHELFRNLKKKNKSSITKTKKQIFKGQKIKSNFFND